MNANPISMRKILIILGVWLMTITAVTAQSTRMRVRNFSTRDGMASNVVNCGLQDRMGYIWLGTNHGLTRFDGHRFANFYVEHEGEIQIQGIEHIVEDSERGVLLLSGKGYSLLCFDLNEMRFVSADGMTFPQNDGKKEQAYIERARYLGIDRGNKTNRRHDLHYTRLDDGRELFATIDNGFYVYEPKGKMLQHFSANDENPLIESDYINGILKDRSGGVWLLTTFAGIYRLEMGEEILYDHTSVPNTRSFVQLDSLRIGVADMNGHVYSYDPDSRQSNLIFDRGIRTYAMNIDSKGRLWMGTRGEGVFVDNKRIDTLPVKQIYDIKFSEKGTVWIASLDGGLVEVHEKPDGSFYYIQHFPKEGIHEIDIDLMDRVWIATEGGIFRMDGQKKDTIFNKGKVVCICHSPNGITWAGSNGYGLLRIENDQISYIRAENGLANNCVESVVCDDQGNVIAGTDQGISIVNSSDGSVRNIYSRHGLRADTYNENAILHTDKGRIFLGNLTGLVELKNSTADNTKQNLGVMPPSITSIDINNEPRYDHLTDEICLSHDQNNLCFSFSSFAYQDVSSVIYSYWLEGVDRDWRPSTKESQALFTNLSPGHYKLHVRSRLAGTNWSDETVSDIYIAQPWYWTWWARAFYLIVIALLIWYEWHQYQQRLSLRRQLDQRLATLYAVEVQQEQVAAPAIPAVPEASAVSEAPAVSAVPEAPLSSSKKDKAFLDKLDHLILENLLQTDLDVNFIAHEMCMSYSTLHRRIKSATGMSANEYVRKHRLAKAMQLLHDGHNATEVSLQCGFNSPSYFTRCFKAEYGILPSEVGD